MLKHSVLALAIPAFGLLGCGDEAAKDPLAGLTVVHEDASGAPISGLSAKWMDRFTAGDALFDKTYFYAQGLGPVYIRQSFAGCHGGDGRGPGAVRKMVLIDADGVPLKDQSALEFGHT